MMEKSILRMFRELLRMGFFFCFGALNVIFCALLQVQPLLVTQNPDTEGSERWWVGVSLGKCKR